MTKRAVACAPSRGHPIPAPGGRTRQLAAAAALAVLALTLLPAASAHEAPSPRDYETRLLHDWNDDCGGDGGAATGACRGSLDLIALDVQERHDPVLGHAVAFRFLMDKGAGGSQRVTLTMDGGRSFELATSDGAAFTGTGFDRVGAAASLGDGTRFAVEAVARASSLGGSGATLSGLKVEAAGGSGVGDFMPGGCNSAIGACIDAGQSASQYIRPAYPLRGAGYYVTLTGPAAAEAGGITELGIRNDLRRSAQSVTLTATDGAMFHDAAGQEKAAIKVELAGAQSATAHLLAKGGSGTVTVTAVTDLGGRSTLTLPVTATATSSSTSSSGSSSSAPSPPATETKESPLPLLALVVALLASALARRTAP